MSLVARFFDHYAAYQGPHLADLGVAKLIAARPSEPGREAALAAWIEEVPAALRMRSCSAFAGPMAAIAGLAELSSTDAHLRPMWEAAARHTRRVAGAEVFRAKRGSWESYDLLSGASGVLLAASLVADGSFDGLVDELLSYLTGIAADDDFADLRVSRGPAPKVAPWNVGRLNTGMGHGVAGVVSALVRGAEVTGNQLLAADALDAADRLAQLYVRHVIEEDGQVDWPMTFPDSRDERSPVTSRRAWCYGAPGIGAMLRTMSRATGDRECAELGDIALRGFVRSGCGGIDGPSLCHGHAGALVVVSSWDDPVESCAEDLRASLRRSLERQLSSDPDGNSSVGFVEGLAGMALATELLDADERSWTWLLGIR